LSPLGSRGVGKQIGAVLATPRLESSGIVVGREHHTAVTLAVGSIAYAIGVTAVVQADLALTNITIISRHAHTSTDRIFNGTPNNG